MTTVNFDPSHINLCIDFNNLESPGDYEMRRFIIHDTSIPLDHSAIDHSIWCQPSNLLCDSTSDIDELELHDMLVRFPSANDPTCR